MANQMSWNNNKYQYEFELENGDLLTVSGDEFSEAVMEREQGNPEAFDEMISDITGWVNLAGDNPNVEIIPAGER